MLSLIAARGKCSSSATATNRTSRVIFTQGLSWIMDPRGSRRSSNGTERSALTSRELDSDAVASAHSPSSDDNSHDATLSFYRTVLSPAEYLAQQSWLKAVDLSARVSQSRDTHARVSAEVQQRVCRQAKEVDPASRHVLAHLARCD